MANYGSDNISVLLGIGDGTFAPQAIYAAGTDPCAVAVADLNPHAPAADDLNGGDYRDLVTVNENDDDVLVLWNRHRPKEFDFGDAPDPKYPTLLASDGARHTATGPTLGPNRDIGGRRPARHRRRQ